MLKKIAVLVGLVGTMLALPAHAGELKKLDVDETRQIIFRGEVNEELVTTSINKLVKLDKADKKKPIYIIINSGGGSVPDGFHFISALKATDAPTVCIVDTQAYSMAAIILEYCGTRYVEKFSDIMFHEAAYSLRGTQSHIKSEVTHFNAMLDIFGTDIAKKLGLPYTTYVARTQIEWWMTAQEAVAAGAADGVVESVRYVYEPPPPELDLSKLFGDTDTTKPLHKLEN